MTDKRKALRGFEERLNDPRSMDVSAAFHEIVAAASKALTAAAPTEGARDAWAQQDERDALSDERAQMLWDEACDDGPGRPGWSRHLRFAKAVAHEAIASFLDRTGKYVTNDASREAAIADAVRAAQQVQAAAAVGTAVGTLLCGEIESTSLGYEIGDVDVDWNQKRLEEINAANPGARFSLYAHPDPLLAECVEALDSALLWMLVADGPLKRQKLGAVLDVGRAVLAKVQAAKGGTQ